MIAVLQNRDNVTLSLLFISLFSFSLPYYSKTLNTILSKSGVSPLLSFLLLLFFPIEFNLGYGSISYSFCYANVCSSCVCSPGLLSLSDVELVKSPLGLC